MKKDKLLNKLRQLILIEGKDLTSKEVLEVSKELDKIVLEKTKEMNKDRLNKRKCIKFCANE